MSDHSEDYILYVTSKAGYFETLDIDYHIKRIIPQETFLTTVNEFSYIFHFRTCVRRIIKCLTLESYNSTPFLKNSEKIWYELTEVVIKSFGDMKYLHIIPKLSNKTALNEKYTI